MTDLDHSRGNAHHLPPLLFSEESRSPTLAEKKNELLQRISLPYLSIPPSSLTGLFSNSFKTPEIQPSQRILQSDTTLTHLHTQSVKATGSPADPLVVVAVSFIPQDRFVTKWASCEYHLGTTYLKLAEVPWQPAWQ